jgi:hypothetical protein
VGGVIDELGLLRRIALLGMAAVRAREDEGSLTSVARHVFRTAGVQPAA